MSKAQDNEIVVEGAKAKAGELRPDVEPKSDIVRFWSPLQSFKIAIRPDANLTFQNHALCLKADDPDVAVIRGKMPYDTREVVDRPFEDDALLAKFNKFLMDTVFIGERGEPSSRGILAVEGLFSPSELQNIGAIGRERADQLIIKALKGKSFKRGI